MAALRGKRVVRRVQALEAIHRHMHLDHAPSFNASAVESVKGYDGDYSGELAPGEAAAVARLRRMYSKSLHDLDALLLEHGLDAQFPGLANEL